MGRFSERKGRNTRNDEEGKWRDSAREAESRRLPSFFSVAFRGDAGIISSPGYFIHARLTPLRKSPVAGPCAVNGACEPRLHNAIVPDACNSSDCWDGDFNAPSDFSFLKPCTSYRLIDGYCASRLY